MQSYCHRWSSKLIVFCCDSLVHISSIFRIHFVEREQLANASHQHRFDDKHRRDAKSIRKCIVWLCKRRRSSRREYNIFVEVLRCAHRSRSLSPICVLKHRWRSEQHKTTLSHFGRWLSFNAFSSSHCSSKRLYSLINVIYDKNETLLSVYFSKQICYACVQRTIHGSGEMVNLRHMMGAGTMMPTTAQNIRTHLLEGMGCTWNWTL